VSGALHFHFWNLIQRLHQHHSLQEIAAMLEKGLIAAEALKKFCAELCCESYPDTSKMREEIAETERCWPCFKESPETGPDSAEKWGAHRFGRIPPFVWEDKG